MVPFIYNNMTEFPFESLWPITGEQFEALDHDLAIKFPKVHGTLVVDGRRSSSAITTPNKPKVNFGKRL